MSTTLKLCSVRVAGLAYYGFESIKNKQDMAGDICDFLEEPDNKHDKKAVEIYYGETKLGYVPKPYNEIIFSLLKQEDKCVVYGKIMSVNVDDQSIVITVFVEV